MKSAARRVTDEMLLGDLRRVDKLHGRVTVLAYQEHGSYCVETIIGRFGSWTRARVQAGISDATERMNVEQQDVKRAQQRPRKSRVCLKCDVSFLSYGPHNRICERCTVSNESIMHGTAEAGIVHPRRWRQAV
jgi:hypothetical protein